MTNFRTRTDSQESSVGTQTDFYDHMLAVINAVENGWYLGNEVCCRWAISDPPGYHDCWVQRGSGQDDFAMLDDYFSKCLEEQQTYPPQ